jgi:hypothetical protein
MRFRTFTVSGMKAMIAETAVLNGRAAAASPVRRKGELSAFT